MKKKASYAKQFKGKMPRQPADETERVDHGDALKPNSKKRLGMQLGVAAEARPGEAGLSDYSHKPKRGK